MKRKAQPRKEGRGEQPESAFRDSTPQVRGPQSGCLLRLPTEGPGLSHRKGGQGDPGADPGGGAWRVQGFPVSLAPGATSAPSPLPLWARGATSSFPPHPTVTGTQILAANGLIQPQNPLQGSHGAGPPPRSAERGTSGGRRARGAHQLRHPRKGRSAAAGAGGFFSPHLQRALAEHRRLLLFHG